MKTNRVVFVTGAGGGIGAVAVDRFLENGDTVIAADLRSDDITAFARSRGDNPRLLTASGDVSSEGDCASLAEFARDRAGRVDVLVNCAGYFPIKPFEQIAAAEWRRVVDINLTGVFLMVRAMLLADPRRARLDRRGRRRRRQRRDAGLQPHRPARQLEPEQVRLHRPDHHPRGHAVAL